MNLWIRSQNKETLIKCESIGVDENTIQINFEDGVGFIFGQYKTKERALEILYQIQSILVKINADNEKSKMLGNIGFGIIEPKDVFIQMPKD